jgi:hypothetical protein
MAVVAVDHHTLEDKEQVNQEDVVVGVLSTQQEVSQRVLLHNQEHLELVDHLDMAILENQEIMVVVEVLVL